MVSEICRPLRGLVLGGLLLSLGGAASLWANPAEEEAAEAAAKTESSASAAAAGASTVAEDKLPSWIESATAGARVTPRSAEEDEASAEAEAGAAEGEKPAEAAEDADAPKPGSPEFPKWQKEQKKAERAAAKQREKEARVKADAELRSAREREKKRREAEKDLSKEDRENWDIREAAFRYVMSEEKEAEVVFLSFTPLDSVHMKWTDPPENFTPRLLDMPLQVRPASSAVLTRYPVADPERPNRMVQDPVTKRAASIYWADVLKESKGGEVRVDAGCFRGFLKSWGCILIMEKNRGVWRVKAQTSIWKT